LGQSEGSSDEDVLARLPRGPHRLSAEEVKASQRARLIRSMLDLVGERGWSETTVPQVVAAARVSKNAFYELFDDKVDCYLAAVDEQVGELLAAMRVPPAADWRETLEHGMGVYLRWWQDRPLDARAYLVELPEAGARAVEQRERAYDVLGRVFARLASQIRAELPQLEPVQPVALRAIVAAITEDVAREVRQGRVDRLGDRAPELMWLVVKLLADDAAAHEFAGRKR
jgi:AcrR family transcriptional regulator